MAKVFKNIFYIACLKAKLFKNIFSIALFYFCIAGCTSTMHMKVDISSTANYNSAIQLDIVFIYSRDASFKISQLPAAQWFESRGQLRKDLEMQNQIKVLSYELAPGQKLIPQIFTPSTSPLNVVLFANYATPGEHRIVFKRYRYMNVHLLDSGFTVTEGSKDTF